MKRLKLLLLPFLVCLSTLAPIGCGEKEETPSNGLVFVEHVGGKSYALQSLGSCEDEKIVIPSAYKGKPVSRITERAFYGASHITEIVFPETIVEIASNAFKGCEGLTEVYLPSSLTDLGSSAFAECYNLETVNFKKDSKLEKIGSSAFDSCTSLERFTVPSRVQDIGSYAFQYCTGLEEMIFLEGATYSPESYAMWMGCSNLKVAYLPGTVKQFAWAVFQGCNSLETVFCGTQAEYSVLASNKYYNLNSNGPFWSAKHYIYSEDEPREEGRFWHYVKGKMTIWE